MNKPTAIKRFIFLGVFLAIGIVLTFCSFNIPFTNYTYNGFANAIKLGLDLKGGVLAVYEASELEGDTGEVSFSDKLNATKTRLSSLITADYTEAVVSIQQGNRIRIEVPDVSDPQEVFDLIGEPARLEIKKENDPDAEAVLTGQNIVSATAQYDTTRGEYGVNLKFDAEGSQIFYDLTSEMSGKDIYIFISGELFSHPTVNEAIAGGSTFISGSMSTLKEAEDFAMKLLSGTFSVNLTLLENSVVSATLGVDALKYGLIAGAIGLILIFAFMIWRYRMMGLLADFALCFYIIFMFFFLQAIPLVQLTLAGIAGIILSIGMAIDGNIIVFERIKEEFRQGKRIEPSIRTGFKKALPSILDANITTIIAAVILLILGTGSIQGFAVTLLIGIVLSMFSSLVVTRGLLNMYYPLNSTAAAKYGLRREASAIELR